MGPWEWPTKAGLRSTPVENRSAVARLVLLHYEGQLFSRRSLVRGAFGLRRSLEIPFVPIFGEAQAICSGSHQLASANVPTFTIRLEGFRRARVDSACKLGE